MRLAAELGLQVRTLHERDPGARAQASRQEGVQSGRWRHQYQLDGNKLACANSAEAARQRSSPQFHVSQVDCVYHAARKIRLDARPPTGVYQLFHTKPLDAAIGRVLTPYWPGGRHGHQCCRRVQNMNKTQHLASDYCTFLLAELLIFVT